MDITSVRLPSEVKACFLKALTDRNLPVDDPLSALLLAIVSLNEMHGKRMHDVFKQMRRWFIFGFLLSAATLGVGGYFIGRWSEAHETLQARPMITASEPGLSIGYGGVISGKRTVTVTSGKDKILNAWSKDGIAHIIVQ